MLLSFYFKIKSIFLKSFNKHDWKILKMIIKTEHFSNELMITDENSIFPEGTIADFYQ